MSKMSHNQRVALSTVYKFFFFLIIKEQKQIRVKHVQKYIHTVCSICIVLLQLACLQMTKSIGGGGGKSPPGHASGPLGLQNVVGRMIADTVQPIHGLSVGGGRASSVDSHLQNVVACLARLPVADSTSGVNVELYFSDPLVICTFLLIFAISSSSKQLWPVTREVQPDTAVDAFTAKSTSLLMKYC